ncbi:MAG: PTS glucose transporter subunit IIA [Oscillospiraceae bacterium]|nr:PTS glucose transporter subunit IIA [Oscillospiraceae bacterium]
MFWNRKPTPVNEHPGKIFAPFTGTALSVDKVPDPVFSEKILGDGAAVLPEDGLLCSPVDGVVETVADTFHAYGLHTADGLDILIHVGLETVSLEGKGFSPLVKQGARVKKGDPLCRVDLAYLKSQNCPLYSPVLITNPDSISSMSVTEGPVIAGETCIAVYQL